MNAARRQDIQRAIDLLAAVQAIIEAAATEERDYYDNMPESFQDGEKGQRADEVASALEEQDSAIQDVISELEGAVQ